MPKSAKLSKKRKPKQHQDPRPGLQTHMHPRPIDSKNDRGSGRLHNKVALITGGDSGIGRAVGIAYAKEGADVAIVYLNEHSDAQQTKKAVERHGRRCFLIAGDIGDEVFCRDAVAETVKQLGGLDILVNNAAEQHPQDSIAAISADQLMRTFKTNIFAMFYLTKAVMPHLKPGSTIINTTSITAYRGSPKLLDYSSTKGAIVAFTRSLAKSLAEKEIRVNGVAPGPIWTPLITSTFDKKKVGDFGTDTPMKRPGEPAEIAPCFVFLASDDSSYMSGQILHPNGGEVVNG